MNGKSETAKAILDRIQGSNHTFSVDYDGCRYVFVQIPAREMGFEHAKPGTNLVYYCSGNPEVIELMAGRPLSLFGVQTMRDGFYIQNPEYPIKMKGCMSLGGLQGKLNERARDITEEYYDSLDTGLVDGHTLDSFDPGRKHKILDAARKMIFLEGYSKYFVNGECTLGSVDKYIPLATQSMAIAYLCGMDFAGHVRQCLNGNKAEMIACKKDQETLNWIAEHPEKIFAEWEVEMADALVPLPAEFVSVEFTVKGKTGNCKVNKNSLVHRLCFSIPFEFGDFDTKKNGKELTKELCDDCHLLGCQNISKIMFKNKVIYSKN